MRHSIRILRLAALAIGCSGVLSAAAHAAVGSRVLVQDWNPATPDRQNVRVVADSPSDVSDAVQNGWTQVRDPICTTIKSAMSQVRPAGQTLYDIVCRLGDRISFTIASSVRANSLQATIAIDNLLIEATSTQPTPAGRYADPRFSLTLKARLDLTLVAQSVLGSVLRVDNAAFTLSNATLDSQNAAGDVAIFVADKLVPFFGGPNYKQLVENAINGSRNLTAPLNTILAGINPHLKGPENYGLAGIWGRPDRIVIAFTPPPAIPSLTGNMSGTVEWPASAAALCDTIEIDAAVQIGPAPLLNPDNVAATGIPPTRSVGRLTVLKLGAHTCSYNLTGLAAGWPNQLSGRLKGATAGSAGSGIVHVTRTLRAQGWVGFAVTPQPTLSNRNYVVVEGTTLTGVQQKAVQPNNPGDPAARFPSGQADPQNRWNNPAVSGSAGSPAPTPNFGATAQSPSAVQGAGQNRAPSAFGQQR